jgi:hypothetical protein
VAPPRMAAEPVAVRRNWRSGVFWFSDQAVAVAAAVAVVAESVAGAVLACWGSVMCPFSPENRSREPNLTEPRAASPEPVPQAGRSALADRAGRHRAGAAEPDAQGDDT